ncbi:MAG: patatin-like phospholipase family protein [Eggerthellaceae bacterium]|nr:patatin-like phospholipase family protein [Eggerthellaceae bacterium]
MGTVAQGPRKVGLIDVGGGLRGAYGAGVLDRCIDDGIRFDYCIGVSAGSANVAAFLAGQKGRNLRFYADYSARPAFMGLGALRASGSFLDVEYVYGTLSQEDGEDPLDVAAVREAGVPCELVATDARTGAACYLYAAAQKRRNPERTAQAPSEALPDNEAGGLRARGARRRSRCGGRGGRCGNIACLCGERALRMRRWRCLRWMRCRWSRRRSMRPAWLRS